MEPNIEIEKFETSSNSTMNLKNLNETELMWCHFFFVRNKEEMKSLQDHTNAPHTRICESLD